jgi:hypothetical protein
MLNIQQAKDKLQAGGWTYRSAAPVLGVSLSWLGRVLSGKINSRRLLKKIERLPAVNELEVRHE